MGYRIRLECMADSELKERVFELVREKIALSDRIVDLECHIESNY